MAILSCENIKKNFGSTTVLKDISFELEKGKTLAIIGSSGSGKTTLLRCLNFLETPTEGIIKINNEVILQAPSKEKSSDKELREKRLNFGLVFQSFNLFPQYTALENIMLAPKVHLNADKSITNKADELKRIEEKAKELLDMMGLANRADHYPHQLSGGQQQRVAIARALALEPKILCFDEPTSALDPELTGEVLRVIKEMAKRHMTMIIVTHEMSFAKEVADEVIFMDKGYIVEKGPAKEVIGNPQMERTKEFLSNYL